MQTVAPTSGTITISGPPLAYSTFSFFTIQTVSFTLNSPPSTSVVDLVPAAMTKITSA